MAGYTEAASAILLAAKANAAKTGSFNPVVLEKGLSEMQKIFEELGI